METWMSGKYAKRDLSAVSFDELSFTQKRKRLLAESNYTCTSCGFSKTRECGGSILEIDHIDGNHANNLRENLRVLCPNCHALTPNFRNWGRLRKEKSSQRFRKGNVGFADIQQQSRDARLAARKMQNEIIMQAAADAFASGAINFRKWGWVGRFNEYLTQNHNMMFEQQTVSKRVKELMPDFYAQHCHKKI